MPNSPTPKSDAEGALPKSFKIVLGTLLLFISVGLMSFLGVFA